MWSDPCPSSQPHLGLPSLHSLCSTLMAIFQFCKTTPFLYAACHNLDDCDIYFSLNHWVSIPQSGGNLSKPIWASQVLSNFLIFKLCQVIGLLKAHWSWVTCLQVCQLIVGHGDMWVTSERRSWALWPFTSGSGLWLWLSCLIWEIGLSAWRQCKNSLCENYLSRLTA